MKAVTIILAVVLAGCGTGVGGLAPPAGRLMQSPAALGDLKEGDELVKEHANLRRQYSQCSSRLKGLQLYVKSATKD